MLQIAYYVLTLSKRVLDITFLKISKVYYSISIKGFPLNHMTVYFSQNHVFVFKLSYLIWSDHDGAFPLWELGRPSLEPDSFDRIPITQFSSVSSDFDCFSESSLLAEQCQVDLHLN